MCALIPYMTGQNSQPTGLSFFGCVLPPAGLYLLFIIILVKHSSLALFKTLCCASGILYQEDSNYKIYVCGSLTSPLFLFFLLAAEEVNAKGLNL